MLDPGLAIRIAVGLWRILLRRIRVIGSTSWPMADGKIFDGRVKPSEISGWAVELTYSYSAFGEYYSGSFVKAFTRKKHAEAFLERFPRGTPLPVRYKAENAAVSTLLLSDI